jgi:hypothetical protein
MDLYFGLPEDSNFRLAIDLNAFSQLIAAANEIQMQTLRLFVSRYDKLDEIMGDVDWNRLTFKPNVEITITEFEQFFVHIAVYVSLVYSATELRNILSIRENDDDRQHVSDALNSSDDIGVANIFVSLSSIGISVGALFLIGFTLRKLGVIARGLGLIGDQTASLIAWSTSARGAAFVAGSAIGGIDVGLAASTAAAIVGRGVEQSVLDAAMANEVSEIGAFRYGSMISSVFGPALGVSSEVAGVVGGTISAGIVYGTRQLGGADNVVNNVSRVYNNSNIRESAIEYGSSYLQRLQGNLRFVFDRMTSQRLSNENFMSEQLVLTEEDLLPIESKNNAVNMDIDYRLDRDESKYDVLETIDEVEETVISRERGVSDVNIYQNKDVYTETVEPPTRYRSDQSYADEYDLTGPLDDEAELLTDQQLADQLASRRTSEAQASAIRRQQRIRNEQEELKLEDMDLAENPFEPALPPEAQEMEIMDSVIAEAIDIELVDLAIPASVEMGVFQNVLGLLARNSEFIGTFFNIIAVMGTVALALFSENAEREARMKMQALLDEKERDFDLQFRKLMGKHNISSVPRNAYTKFSEVRVITPKSIYQQGLEIVVPIIAPIEEEVSEYDAKNYIRYDISSISLPVPFLYDYGMLSLNYLEFRISNPKIILPSVYDGLIQTQKIWNDNYYTEPLQVFPKYLGIDFTKMYENFSEKELDDILDNENPDPYGDPIVHSSFTYVNRYQLLYQAMMLRRTNKLQDQYTAFALLHKKRSYSDIEAAIVLYRYIVHPTEFMIVKLLDNIHIRRLTDFIKNISLKVPFEHIMYGHVPDDEKVMVNHTKTKNTFDHEVFFDHSQHKFGFHTLILGTQTAYRLSSDFRSNNITISPIHEMVFSSISQNDTGLLATGKNSSNEDLCLIAVFNTSTVFISTMKNNNDLIISQLSTTSKANANLTVEPKVNESFWPQIGSIVPEIPVIQYLYKCSLNDSNVYITVPRNVSAIQSTSIPSSIRSIPTTRDIIGHLAYLNRIQSDNLSSYTNQLDIVAANISPLLFKTPIQNVGESFVYENLRPDETVTFVRSNVDSKIRAHLFDARKESIFQLSPPNRDDVVGMSLSLGLTCTVFISVLHQESIQAKILTIGVGLAARLHYIFSAAVVSVVSIGSTTLSTMSTAVDFVTDTGLNVVVPYAILPVENAVIQIATESILYLRDTIFFVKFLTYKAAHLSSPDLFFMLKRGATTMFIGAGMELGVTGNMTITKNLVIASGGVVVEGTTFLLEQSGATAFYDEYLQYATVVVSGVLLGATVYMLRSCPNEQTQKRRKIK